MTSSFGKSVDGFIDGSTEEIQAKKNGELVVHYEKPPSMVSVENPEENEPEPKPKKVSIRKLWGYASGKDFFLIFLGILVSIVTGVGFPLMSIVIGNISDSFIKMTIKQTPGSVYTYSNNTTVPYDQYYTNDDFKKAVLKNVIVYAIIGTATLISAFTQVSCFLVSGENLIHKMRKAFLRAIMRQDISWFDKHNSGTLTTKLFDNLERVQEGTGDKVGLLVQFLSQFFSGFIIAFTYDWKLTLIMLSVSPFLIIAGGFLARVMASSVEKEAKMYAKAGSVAEQALTSIRTVVAFNGQTYECDRYNVALKEGKNTGIVKSTYIGLGLSVTFVIMFSSYCLAFWVGTNFIANGTMEAKTVLTVFFSIMMSSMALGQAGQQFAVVGAAQGAAAAIFEIIDRTPEIDCYSLEGSKPDNIRGEIRVKDVEFSYPTRKDIKILNKISFDVQPGQTIALVGSSGCGKSTIVQLLLRYYDLDLGEFTRQASVVSARSRSSSVSSVRAVGRKMSLTIDGIEDIPKVEDEKSVLKRLKEDLAAEGATESDLLKILKHARPEWAFLIIATISSIIQGLVFPMFSIFFTEIITVFSTTDMDKLRRDGHKWALSFLILGAVQGTCLMTQAVLFGLSAERLTMRLRSKLFRNIMRMDISYFDMPIHSSGKLSTRLATDCPNVKSAIDFRLGSVFSAIVSVSCGIGIGFYYGWQMALLMIALFPVVAVGRSLQFRYLKGKVNENARDSENAGNLALEAIENIRTVQALTLQDKFNLMFANYLEGPHRTSTRKHLIQGVTYGFASSIMFYMNAASFGWGLYLILHNVLTPMHVLRVLFAISFTGGTVGFAAAYFPEYNKAKIAAGIIFRMLSESPAFDSFSSEGKRPTIRGSVQFKNIHFSYPQRKEVMVLKGLNVEVNPGETLALVGSSGCGKSTVVSLLERFYDPASGNIVVDGEELRDLNLQHTSTRSIFKLLCRWRGSIWKAVLDQLLIWTILYLIISVIYRYVLPESWQNTFDWVVKYLNTGLDSYIPLTFMLGFFVSFVVGRWGSILNGLGWIDDPAVSIATFVRGTDEDTRILRRTLIRYMVLTQTLVLRDISLQVPVPLVYPQVILLAVRLYFLICLFGRQFLRDSEHRDLWLPLATMIQFIVYMGWMKVAEALLNPLGEDDDDLECNYVIDKNLITGLNLVDIGCRSAPTLRKDEFWGNDHIAPLYSLEAAERNVYPMIGSASSVNTITMTPHKNKLVKMSEDQIREHTKVVDVKDHNNRHSVLKEVAKNENPDKILSRVRTRSHGGPLNSHSPVHDIESRGLNQGFDRLSPRVLPGTQNHPRYPLYEGPQPGPDERNFRKW
ncbi:hypothetical protein FO519_001416 [Halicephalobus sp. NKZ332]|nr:hypothetical protein FO519_001416 [Halicephalobus sp. NKZ332]